MGLYSFPKGSPQATSTSVRRKNGSLSAEMPICLTITLVLVAFPFIDLLALSMRYSLLVAACTAAGRSAPSAPTFVANPQNSLSAVNAAQAATNKWCASFTGIKLVSVATVAQPISLLSAGGDLPEQATPFTPEQINTDRFLYQYKIKVKAEIEPLVVYNGSIFGSIPGFTGPLAVECSSQRVCEKPEGLIR